MTERERQLRERVKTARKAFDDAIEQHRQLTAKASELIAEAKLIPLDQLEEDAKATYDDLLAFLDAAIDVLPTAPPKPQEPN